MLGLEPKALHILGKGSTSNLHSSKCITFWVFTVISFVTFVSMWPFFLPRHHCLEEECREVSGIWELLMLLERLKKTEELVSKQGQCKKECPHVPGDPPKRTNLTWNSIPEGSSQDSLWKLWEMWAIRVKNLHFLMLKQQQTGILPLSGWTLRESAPSSPEF